VITEKGVSMLCASLNRFDSETPQQDLEAVPVEEDDTDEDTERALWKKKKIEGEVTIPCVDNPP